MADFWPGVPARAPVLGRWRRRPSWWGVGICFPLLAGVVVCVGIGPALAGPVADAAPNGSVVGGAAETREAPSPSPPDAARDVLRQAWAALGHLDSLIQALEIEIGETATRIEQAGTGEEAERWAALLAMKAERLETARRQRADLRGLIEALTREMAADPPGPPGTPDP